MRLIAASTLLEPNMLRLNSEHGELLAVNQLVEQAASEACGWYSLTTVSSCKHRVIDGWNVRREADP